MSAEDPKVSTEFSGQTERRIRGFVLKLAVFLAVGFAIVAAWKWQQRRELAAASALEQSQVPQVNVVAARGDAGASDLVLPGETAAWFESTLFARVNGYVAHWDADIGDRVRRGQALAAIETPELDAQLNAARAQLNASQAQVRVREAEAALAATTYERWRDSPKGVVSDQEREEKKADHESAEARLNAARAQVALDQAEVDRYAALAQFKLVTTPFDGTIVERRIDVGNLVTAGSTNATTPLYRIAQDKPIRIFVDVPQAASGDVMDSGTSAQITTTGLPGRVFAGHVVRTSRAMNPQARTLKVEIDLPNSDGSLVPGMYVDVAFHLKRIGAGVQVPAAALMFRSGGTQVAVVGADNVLRLRDVTIARDDGAVVELGSGVKDGEKVVLNVSSRLADGDRVQPQDWISPAGAPGNSNGAKGADRGKS